MSLLVRVFNAGIEATNNRAGRALRPAVIARKPSCDNKMQRGKHTWEIYAIRPPENWDDDPQDSPLRNPAYVVAHGRGSD